MLALRGVKIAASKAGEEGISFFFRNGTILKFLLLSLLNEKIPEDR